MRALASGPQGPDALRPLLTTVLDALRDGATARSGPLPAGGPEAVAADIRAALGDVLPEQGDEDALRALVHTFAAGAADPADPLCTAHLHCPPLAVATAADLAASALNPSLDSWDQAPAASELEALVTAALAEAVYGKRAEAQVAWPTAQVARPPALVARPAEPAAQDTQPAAQVAQSAAALVTTGGTESNQLALLLARELHGRVQLVCADTAHHSLRRATWLLGLPEPITVPAPTGTMDPAALDEVLGELHGTGSPLLVAATAGTTDAGHIDPLPAIADLCRTHRARLHIDAAYGGGLLFSDHHRAKLDGLARAHTVTLDLHKLGWQPVAAGLLAVQDPRDLRPLEHHADYLNADDDTEAGLPDLLSRSLRTTRRPDILKIAVTLKTLGRQGLGALVDNVCARAQELADLVDAHPGLELYDRPTISTVLFRPAHATDHIIAGLRRQLLTEGRAVLGRARLDGRLWLKATLLNPHTEPGDLAALLKLVEGPPRR
ncbi:pyridoxal phosphate-dependent decarboxylase family protein [Streptomyces sporangiiformans]|uniref:Aminotransferase class V-fold PLP-dependent enzyme n=1 Tax=Streptomyces sporangiiformans TaxID=2315329 RepID=A0A505DHM0_9ACTN|nr:aminotransferase class V-fold PLP-dependent enzyme [Streptomyces sporangiiformans]TPQ18676.1 aminotransferase class V-fold PLP-dependent enzyme [Streptomyces sporangiiformans]